MKSANVNSPAAQTQPNGKKAPAQGTSTGAKVSGSNAKPSSSRSAKQGEKKTTGG